MVAALGDVGLVAVAAGFRVLFGGEGSCDVRGVLTLAAVDVDLRRSALLVAGDLTLVVVRVAAVVRAFVPMDIVRGLLVAV